jgi:uncharacterized protein (DUF302 family)
MSYTIDRLLPGISIDAAEARSRAALAAKGFGVLTEIDVALTMKKKLDRDMPAYRILGACNPARIGAMLPCNVILRAVEGGIEVSAVDPVASMQAIESPALATVAGQVRQMLAEVVAAI